ncbi:hypothetical protein, partial [Shewanella sp. SR44-4]|uniref:hypothetical protein n=1 Tax=Shewanella sp. SR44-4 TaxID=2760935 RepID=UPI001C71B732
CYRSTRRYRSARCYRSTRRYHSIRYYRSIRCYPFIIFKSPTNKNPPFGGLLCEHCIFILYW